MIDPDWQPMTITEEFAREMAADREIRNVLPGMTPITDVLRDPDKTGELSPGSLVVGPSGDWLRVIGIAGLGRIRAATCRLDDREVASVADFKPDELIPQGLRVRDLIVDQGGARFIVRRDTESREDG